jgi:hypothetical protein
MEYLKELEGERRREGERGKGERQPLCHVLERHIKACMLKGKRIVKDKKGKRTKKEQKKKEIIKGKYKNRVKMRRKEEEKEEINIM